MRSNLEQNRIMSDLAEIALLSNNGGPSPGWALSTGCDLFCARPWLCYLDLSLLNGMAAEAVRRWFQQQALTLFGMGLVVHKPRMPIESPSLMVKPFEEVAILASEEKAPCPILVLVAMPDEGPLPILHLGQSGRVAQQAFAHSLAQNGQLGVPNYDQWTWMRTFQARNLLLLDRLSKELTDNALYERAVSAFLEDLVGRRDTVPRDAKINILLGDYPVEKGLNAHLSTLFERLVRLIRSNQDVQNFPEASRNLGNFSYAVVNSPAHAYTPQRTKPFTRAFAGSIRERYFTLTGEWLTDGEVEIVWRTTYC